jgi:hypothetical protein
LQTAVQWIQTTQNIFNGIKKTTPKDWHLENIHTKLIQHLHSAKLVTCASSLPFKIQDK